MNSSVSPGPALAPIACSALAEELSPLLAQLVLLLRREASHLPVSAPQAGVLLLLKYGPRRVSDLTQGVGVAQPTMTALVDRMERQGWVRRMPDPDDRRAVRVEITRAGQEALAEVQSVRIEALARRLAALSNQQRVAIASALPALAALVEQ